MEITGYLEEIKYLRDGWKNEIPETILCSLGSPKYKCRKGWFQNVVLKIERGIRKGFIDEEQKRFYEEFCRYLDETSIQTRKLICEEDINRADRVLTSIINSLEEKLKIDLPLSNV